MTKTGIFWDKQDEPARKVSHGKLFWKERREHIMLLDHLELITQSLRHNFILNSESLIAGPPENVVFYPCEDRRF